MVRQPPVKRMIGGSIPPAGAEVLIRNLEFGIQSAERLRHCNMLHLDRGSAKGRLPDFGSGDGGSNSSPRAENENKFTKQ